MESASLDKAVEMSESEFIELYRALKPNGGLSELQSVLEAANAFKEYGFRIKYFMDIESGVLGYKPVRKDPIGYLPKQTILLE